MNILQKVREYDVVWKTPSKSDRGYMPLGNGNLSMNLWVEENGDLQFYFSVMDAMTEIDRNVKLGKVRLHLEPNPFRTGGFYRQTLNLADGCVEIDAEDLKIRVFVSKDDVIYLDGKSEKPYQVKASYLNWRTQGTEMEAPDVVADYVEGILFYHRNQKTFIEQCLHTVELDGQEDKVHDMLTNRVFGGFLALSGGKTGDRTITAEPATEFLLKVSAASRQTNDPETFLENLKIQCLDALPTEVAFSESQKEWQQYWQKSYVFIDGDSPVPPTYTVDFDALDLDGYSDDYAPESRLTSAYLLTKYMFRLNSKGKHPIRFNGLEFNTMPGNGKPLDFSHFAKTLSDRTISDPTPECNPDQRPWGDMTLWQNIRHPYFSMLARGEYEEIRVLFDLYMSFGDINRAAAREYYEAEGQYNTEITTSLGTINPGIYGADRTGKSKGYAENRWGGAVDISPGLELTCLMLDYCNYTGDEKYLEKTVVPYAKDLLTYIATRFKNRRAGKIDLYPLHVVETYWDTRNPVTVVGGMHAVIDRCLKLHTREQAFFEEMKVITPELPVTQWNGKPVFDNAEEYDPERHNVEPAELYLLYPYRCFGIEKPGFSMMADTYEKTKTYGNFRPYVIGEAPGAPSYSGWQYLGAAAAMLQKREDVAEILQNNASLTNKAYRFPAIWGPAYDSAPDVDHGGNILSTVQLALLQFDEEKIYLLPALPKKWNASFRLYAPQNTCITCSYKDGKLETLSVEPESRAKDVIFKGE